MTPTTPNPPTLDLVLLSDARIGRIPVVERREDLVRVVAAGRLSVAEAIPVPPADGVAPPAARVHDLLRREVARRQERSKRHPAAAVECADMLVG